MPHPSPSHTDDAESEAPEEPDESEGYEGPPVPEPPRRVPFGVALVAALLGVVSLLTLSLAAAALTSFDAEFSLGRAVGGGLLVTLLAICAAVPAAVGWSFVRNGNQIGALVVGGVVALAGLISLATGMLNETTREAVVPGLLGVALGLVIALLPLLGDAPGYLAARRVWAKAERDWLRDLTAAPAAAATPAWPGGYPGQQWPGPQQPAWPQQQQPWAQQQPWPQQPAWPQQPWAQPQWGAQPQQQWGTPPGLPQPWQTLQAGPPAPAAATPPPAQPAALTPADAAAQPTAPPQAEAPGQPTAPPPAATQPTVPPQAEAATTPAPVPSATSIAEPAGEASQSQPPQEAPPAAAEAQSAAQ